MGRDLGDELMTSLRATDLVVFISLSHSFRGCDHAPGTGTNHAFYVGITIDVQVDTISDVLQQRCGSFCSTDDVMLYKVSR